MKIGIIHRGMIERANNLKPPHWRRTVTMQDALVCRDSIIHNISKPLEASGHIVSHLALGYYNDFESVETITTERQRFFAWFDQSHLQKISFNDSALAQIKTFKKIFEPGTFNLRSFDAIVILRFDCFFKSNDFWNNIEQYRDCDLLLPWVENSYSDTEKTIRNLPDTLHILFNLDESAFKMLRALELHLDKVKSGKIKNHNGMHNTHTMLQELAVSRISNSEHKSGSNNNPFYFISNIPKHV